MSYQVLARKWRPQTFADVAGQRHVLSALGNALDSGRIHHAYLLTGTRGVGKTTIARILARCLNCEAGVTATPCGQCASCSEITEGRSVDLIEVDAASRTKVENMRELLDNVQYAPSQSRYKVYLIDEVHMLSNHSFNALLKTLEEPPPHVVFLFATTHPQKIPPTVLSRCLQFHLKNIGIETIQEQLAMIFNAESVEYDQAGLAALANAAGGSMRDALSLADQAIGFSASMVTGEAVHTMLGSVDGEVVAAVLSAVIDNDGSKVLALIAEYDEKGMDHAQLVDDLLALLHRIAVEQLVPGAGAEGRVQNAFIVRCAGSVSPQDVQLYYQILLAGRRDLALVPDPMMGVEMLLVRLLAFQPASVGTEGLDPNGASSGQPIGPATDIKTTGETLAGKAVPAKKKLLSDSDVPSAPAGDLAQSSVSTAVKTPAVKGDEGPALSSLDAAMWCEIYASIPLSGIVRTVGSYCVPLEVDDKSVTFALDSSNATLYDDAHPEKLAKGLSIYFSQPVRVEVRIQSCAKQNPAEYRVQKKQQQHDAALQSLQEDDNVRAIIETFDGSIDETTVVVRDI